MMPSPPNMGRWMERLDPKRRGRSRDRLLTSFVRDEESTMAESEYVFDFIIVSKFIRSLSYV